jgi:hypothetical protein
MSMDERAFRANASVQSCPVNGTRGARARLPARLALVAFAVAFSLSVRAALAQEPAPPAPAEPPWSSGYHNGSFYIRSPDDVFRLYVQGRVHVDYYAAFASGLGGLAPGQAVSQGFELRRARLELAGEFFQTWQWQIGAEFAPSTDDNVAANTASLVCKVNGTTSVETCSPQENPVDNPSVKPAPTDAFINYAGSPWTNVQVGQFYLPFTLENRISDNTTAFLERALVVRSIGAPLQRDIGAMFWGESPDQLLYYTIGIFNGDGPNRPNADSRYDFAGRAFVRPLIKATATSSRWAEFGFSVHGGSRDPKMVGYDMPALTTSQGFAFWKPTYTDSYGRLIHILPSAAQQAYGGDVYVPIGRFDVTGEFVYANYQTREAVDGLQLSPFTERLGALEGWGLYAQLGYWIVGDYGILDYPSYARPIHVDLSKPQQPPRHGVQVLARVDQLSLTYQGASRGGAPNPKTPDGDVDVTSFTLGANYWATRHLRVSVNYGYYALPAHSLLSTLHEVSARVGVQF